MDVFDGNQFSENGQKRSGEVRVWGNVMSRGIAIGRVVCLHGRKRQFYRIEIRQTQVDRELRRFQAAIRLAIRQLKSLESSASASASSIVDVHRMILEDSSLLSKIEETISTERVNAEWAVKVVTDSYIAKFKAIKDEHLRTRFVDIEDVTERMLAALGGGRRSPIKLDKNSIIIASEVNPSTLIELSDREPAGLVTEHGGWTSHTFILAREISIPAITGVKRILRKVQTGQTVIVDGIRGQLILNPSPQTVREYRPTTGTTSVIDRQEISEITAFQTIDGREITIRSNIDFPSAYKLAKKQGAKGIGLYRSEFLFNQFRGFPSETEQIEAYSRIADLAGTDGVKIRTFDLSADQLTEQNLEKEKNPALGVRGIRLSLSYPRLFRTQLRAILVASHGRKIDLVLPMVTDISEINQVKELLTEEAETLNKKGIAYGVPRLGVMIEVPAAIMTIDEIIAAVDFVSLGTNDLVQYILGVDRDNEAVADWFQTLHPAVIRAIRLTLNAANKKGIPAIICGEMAGSPFYVPLLIGLGAEELSMNVNSIGPVRTVINGVSHTDALMVAEQVDNCGSAQQAFRVMKDAVEAMWSNIIPPEILNSIRIRKI